MGPYRLATNRLVNGLPCWKHVVTNKIMFSGSDGFWYIACDDNVLARNCGLLRSMHPHGSCNPSQVPAWGCAAPGTMHGRRCAQCGASEMLETVPDGVVEYSLEDISVEPIGEVLEAMDVYDAGNRIGALRDAWFENAVLLETMFSDESVDEEDPYLRMFFQQFGGRRERPRSKSQEMLEPAGKFEVGDKVYARVADGLRETFGNRSQNSLGITCERQWYPATICELLPGDRFRISWDEGDLDDCIKGVRELTRANYDIRSGAEDFIRNYGHRPNITFHQLVEVLLLFGISISGLQAYVSFMEKEPPQYFLGGGAALLSTVNILLCAFISWFVLPAAFRCLGACAPSLAKSVRRLFLVVFVDPYEQHELREMQGRAEQCVIVVCAGVFLTFAAITLATREVGVLAFGSMASRSLLQFVNCIDAETGGIQQMRKRHFFATAEKLRQNLSIDLSAAELKFQLIDFFDQEPRNQVLRISKELFVLLAAGTRVENADSCRLRYLIVQEGFVEMSHPPYPMPALYRRHRDITIDLFDRTTSVPGIDMSKERWHIQGEKLPWHLAMIQQDVANAEPVLWSMGYPFGNGLFSWAPGATGAWAAPEAGSSKDLYELTAELAARKVRLSQALLEVQDHMKIEEAEVSVSLLIEARADVNFSTAELSGFTALHGALQDGNIGIAQILVECGANTQALYHPPQGEPFTPLAWAHRHAQRSINDKSSERREFGERLLQVVSDHEALFGGRPRDELASVSEPAPDFRRALTHRRLKNASQRKRKSIVTPAVVKESGVRIVALSSFSSDVE